MLRAISLYTTHRTPARLTHRARPDAGHGGKMSGNVRKSRDILMARRKETELTPAQQEELRAAYIDFITRLMHRMKKDGIERMLDAALEQEID